MDTPNTKYKAALAVLTVAVFAMSAVTAAFFRHANGLDASLRSANERIMADSLLITHDKLMDDELLAFLNNHDSTRAGVVRKADLLPFLDTLLRTHANEKAAFQNQLAKKAGQMDWLNNQRVELEHQLDASEIWKSYAEGKMRALETGLMLQKKQLDSVAAELEKRELELASTALDSLVFYAPNGNKVYYFGKVVDQSPKDFGIGFYEGKGHYMGEWKGNLRHGWGRHTYKDNAVYMGYFEDDLRSGFGTYYYHSGDVYKGNWQNDLMEGKGEIISADGKSVKGVWNKGKLKINE